ncbi:hypothetical protein HHK36_018809 [Tetracentron sinense]|uniref:Gamma-interferon-inducible lysosomal thiol reductase n=1 Tax=Tetracentron sinense TaxID=13715 RepID=A0A834YV27_TETSI|nr:hypothetical protein HHK36_018809 [Tetracentron sinense]
MVSGRFVYHFLLFLFVSLPYSSSSATARASSSASQKVSLALYYETLCPYCSSFIVNNLANVFEKGLSTIVDLKLVPYGNARIGSNNTITCQHGSYECLLNTVEACAINVWPYLNKHFTFIYCVERLVLEGKYSEWESCFGKMGLDSKPIADCYNSGYGKRVNMSMGLFVSVISSCGNSRCGHLHCFVLELEYAAETNALQPPHTYVPWVVVDGQPLYGDYKNFVTFVCKAYKGTAVPKACRALPLKIIPKEKANHPVHQVCHTVEKTTSTSPTPTRRIRSPITSWRRQMKMASSV